MYVRSHMYGNSAVFMQTRTRGDFCAKPPGDVAWGWKRGYNYGPLFFRPAYAKGASSRWHRLRMCRAPWRPQRYHRWINMTLLSGPLPDKHSRINIQIERRECSALEMPKGETDGLCTCVRVVFATMSRFSRRVAPGEISLSGHIEHEFASYRDKYTRYLYPRRNDNVSAWTNIM